LDYGHAEETAGGERPNQQNRKQKQGEFHRAKVGERGMNYELRITNYE